MILYKFYFKKFKYKYIDFWVDKGIKTQLIRRFGQKALYKNLTGQRKAMKKKQTNLFETGHMVTYFIVLQQTNIMNPKNKILLYK